MPVGRLDPSGMLWCRDKMLRVEARWQKSRMGAGGQDTASEDGIGWQCWLGRASGSRKGVGLTAAEAATEFYPPSNPVQLIDLPRSLEGGEFLATHHHPLPNSLLLARPFYDRHTFPLEKGSVGVYTHSKQVAQGHGKADGQGC